MRVSYSDGTAFDVKRVHKGRTVHEYEVNGPIEDVVDFDIINMCDKGNFGGRVVRSPGFAKVWVYID